MPAGVTLPFDLEQDVFAFVDRVMANFNALAGKFGAIVDGDIATNADIDGNKLSSTSGKQIPEPKLQNNACSARVLASDSNSPGSDVNRAVSGDAIKLLTAAQLSRFMPADGLGFEKLKLGTAAVYSHAATITGSQFAVVNTALSTTNFIPLVAYTTETIASGKYAAMGFIQSGGTWWVFLSGATTLNIASGSLKVVYVHV